MSDGSNLMNDWVRLLKIDNCLFGLLEMKISKKVLRKNNPLVGLRLSFIFIWVQDNITMLDVSIGCWLTYWLISILLIYRSILRFSSVLGRLNLRIDWA
jgi:hypothetical protein